jgi:hypothetical protein
VYQILSLHGPMKVVNGWIPFKREGEIFGIGGANCRYPMDLYNMPIVPRKANDAILYGS